MSYFLTRIVIFQRVIVFSVHDGTDIILPDHVRLVESILGEGCLCQALLDIVPLDGDVLVPVRTRALVPDTQGVHYLVYYSGVKIERAIKDKAQLKLIR